MSGIYIHIPFCKQACHYCDFHFSTNLKKKNEMVLALAKEIEMRSKTSNFQLPTSSPEIIETIYFGGGTPSILSVEDLKFLIDSVYKNYKVVENPEITVEANPDDLHLDFARCDNETICQFEFENHF
jgi:oxygen-independent coproporphyrinogen III oxidase